MVILSNLIRKKVSELPFLAKDDLVENGDDLYFCSSTCYMQFALMHRSPSISEDKVSGVNILNLLSTKLYLSDLKTLFILRRKHSLPWL